MKTCRWCNKEKSLSSFHKHKGMADGHLNKCGSCVVASVAAWRKKTPDARVAEYNRSLENLGKTRYVRMPDRVYKQNRKASAIRYAHKRRLQISERTDQQSELDSFVMDEAISLAQHREETTGIKWHVDHIVPLNHKTVSGLHCAANLQVVPAYWNVRKSNTNCNEFI